MSYQKHYAALYEPLETEYGKLDDDTSVPIVGFSAGGPVCLCTRQSSRLYVSAELCVYEAQKTSMDGVKFEFFSIDDFDEQQARAIFTALGRLSMNARLGNNHTADVSQISGSGFDVVRLTLFTQLSIEGSAFGLYRVCPVQK